MTGVRGRVLVTGGAGFIGTALAERYAAGATEWVAYDSLLPQVHGDSPDLTLPGEVELVVGDVRDRQALAAVVARLRPDVVVHLAAETGTGQSLDEPSRHTDVNVTGTAVLFEALGTTLPERIILTSSRAVYGEGDWQSADGQVSQPGPRTAAMLEQGVWDFPGLTALPSQAGRTQPSPANIYGATKLAQEHLIRSWAAARGVRSAILRLQNVYGPGQSPINPYTGITTLFIQLARAGKVIPVYEDGEIIRDFVLIDDVVTALGTASGAEHDVLADVGSGQATSIRQMAGVAAGIFDAPEPQLSGQFRLGDVRHAACDMAPSEWVRGGTDPVELTDGLNRLADWIRATVPDER